MKPVNIVQELCFTVVVAGAVVVEARPGASSPAFSAGPSVSMKDRGVAIEFSVDQQTDVAVVVRNGDSRVVRHLGAGLLGANAPEPFTRNSLAQVLEWDLLDDDGRPVPSGQYTVEVGLGLTVEPDTCYGWNPYAIGMVHGLGIGPKGELYVMASEGRDGMDGIFRIFSSDGKYLRTILPRPADIPLERAVPLGELCLKTGERFPTVLLPFYGGRSLQTPVITAEGDLIIVNSSPSGHVEGKRFRSKNFEEKLPRRLLRIAADGGAPKAEVLGPLLGEGFDTALLHLAQGPDGLIYISGARHAVFRVRWDEGAVPEPFVGTPDKPGKDGQGLKNPGSIAFDAWGNLYVADRGNHRVAVFDRSRRLVHELDVEWPQSVLVAPTDGTVYVISGYRHFELQKFESPSSSAPVARYALRSDMPVVALDTGGRRRVIYVGNVWREGEGPHGRDRA
ncbi:MAG: hypothetical protein N2255_05200, partial [Kiritimatiellae bacterium]|nr:hypothetical protein [Kiritimatiellia bacterium]